MTKKDYYINKLCTEFNLSFDVAQEIYEAINKRDWAVFCSYMSDYDHPEERVAAHTVFNKFKKSKDEALIDSIADFMKNDEEYNIHKMKDEVL